MNNFIKLLTESSLDGFLVCDAVNFNLQGLSTILRNIDNYREAFNDDKWVKISQKKNRKCFHWD